MTANACPEERLLFTIMGVCSFHTSKPKRLLSTHLSLIDILGLNSNPVRSSPICSTITRSYLIPSLSEILLYYDSTHHCPQRSHYLLSPSCPNALQYAFPLELRFYLDIKQRAHRFRFHSYTNFSLCQLLKRCPVDPVQKSTDPLSLISKITIYI